jgi:hypothetical protein
MKKERGRPKGSKGKKQSVVSGSGKKPARPAARPAAQEKPATASGQPCPWNCKDEFGKPRIFQNPKLLEAHIKYCADRPEDPGALPADFSIPDFLGAGSPGAAAPGIEEKPANVLEFQPGPEMDKKILSDAFDALFNMLAKIRGQHWKLEPYESQALANFWNPVLERYMPKFSENPLYMAGFMTLVILNSRIQKDAELRAGRADSPLDSGNERTGQNYKAA